MITEINLTGRNNQPKYDLHTAAKILTAIGIPYHEQYKVTGMGHRSGFESKADDTRLNKFAAGALSRIGVCGDVFGSDTKEHHQGHGLGEARNLTCCCCGESTKGRQWWNRDTGSGLCSKCSTWAKHDSYGLDFHDYYGVRGVHFDL